MNAATLQGEGCIESCGAFVYASRPPAKNRGGLGARVGNIEVNDDERKSERS